MSGYEQIRRISFSFFVHCKKYLIKKISFFRFSMDACFHFVYFYLKIQNTFEHSFEQQTFYSQKKNNTETKRPNCSEIQKDIMSLYNRLRLKVIKIQFVTLFALQNEVNFSVFVMMSRK